MSLGWISRRVPAGDITTNGVSSVTWTTRALILEAGYSGIASPPAAQVLRIPLIGASAKCAHWRHLVELGDIPWLPPLRCARAALPQCTLSMRYVCDNRDDAYMFRNVNWWIILKLCCYCDALIMIKNKEIAYRYSPDTRALSHYVE